MRALKKRKTRNIEMKNHLSDAENKFSFNAAEFGLTARICFKQDLDWKLTYKLLWKLTYKLES
jgi:hypothetical protein